jgi:hypothetical protein
MLTTRIFEKPITEYLEPIAGKYAISFANEPVGYPAFAMIPGQKSIFLSAMGSVALSSESQTQNQIRNLLTIMPDQAGVASIIYVPELLKDLFLERLAHVLESFEKEKVLYDKEEQPLLSIMPEYGNAYLMFLQDDKGLWFFCSSNYSCENVQIEYLTEVFSKKIKTKSYDPDKVIVLTGQENTGKKFLPWLATYTEVYDYFKYMGWVA